MIEASISIYTHLNTNISSNPLNFESFIIYFPIKLITTVISLFWLRFHKSSLDQEYYQIERDSVFVDLLLTIAILFGLTILSNISAISEVADSITLLIVSSILLITIFSELKHLVYIIIGRRIYVDLEQQLITSLSKVEFTITDIHIEKFGIVYIVFVTCSFTGNKSLLELEQFETQIGTSLNSLGISRYRIELNFKS